jgi:hypothetical protein
MDRASAASVGADLPPRGVPSITRRRQESPLVNTPLRRLPLLALLVSVAVGGAAYATDLAAPRPVPDPVVDLDAIDDELARLEAAGDPSVRIESISEFEAAVAPNGAVTYEYPGTFLHARDGESYVAFDLPLRNNLRYRHATVEFDLYLDRWQSELFHGVFALRRIGEKRNGTLYVGLILRGSKGYKSILDIGVHPKRRRGDIIRSDSGPWRENTLYHVRTDYNTAKRTVTLQVFHNGQLVHVLSGRINNTDLSPRGRKVRVDFGSTKVADGAYFPPLGWSYSNLTVKVTP